MSRSRVRALPAHAVLCVLLGCSVYDPDKIASKPGQIEAEPPAVADAGKDTGDDDDHDKGVDAEMPITPPVGIDTTHCGDGRVTGDEKCDTGIPVGTPGACPIECPALAPCNPRGINNTGCQAECILLQLSCKNDDDCCPGSCSTINDNDCSANCRDGVIQKDNGETCEPGTDTPCKSSDADCNDDNACTADKLVGSADNCNSACTNTPITEAKGGDSCCPPGADANSDSDCQPKCGNGVREGTEECDGNEGCDAQCKRQAMQVEQTRCLEMFGGEGADACARCSCMNCAQSYLTCRSSPEATLNTQCQAVLECARRQDCFGAACYCGDAFFCLAPNGECVREIEAAAQTTDPVTVSDRAMNPMYAVGRAYAADTCRIMQCEQECRPGRQQSPRAN